MLYDIILFEGLKLFLLLMFLICYVIYLFLKKIYMGN